MPDSSTSLFGMACSTFMMERRIGSSKGKGKRKHRSPLQRNDFDLNRFLFRKTHKRVMNESAEEIADGSPRQDVRKPMVICFNSCPSRCRGKEYVPYLQCKSEIVGHRDVLQIPVGKNGIGKGC